MDFFCFPQRCRLYTSIQLFLYKHMYKKWFSNFISVLKCFTCFLGFQLISYFIKYTIIHADFPFTVIFSCFPKLWIHASSTVVRHYWPFHRFSSRFVRVDSPLRVVHLQCKKNIIVKAFFIFSYLPSFFIKPISSTFIKDTLIHDDKHNFYNSFTN